MLGIDIIILVCVGLWLYIIEKKATHPMLILTGIWLLIYTCCYVNVYDYVFKEKYINIIFIGIVGCLIGYFIVKLYMERNRFEMLEEQNGLVPNNSLDTDKKIILIAIELVMLIIMSYYLKAVLDLVSSGVPYAVIRYRYLKNVLGKNRIFNILFAYLVRPFGIFAMPLSQFFLLSKRNKWNVSFFLLELVNTILITVCLGERLYFLYYVCFFVLLFFILYRKSDINIKRKLKKYIIVAILLFGIIFLGISKSRQESSDVNQKNNETLVQKVEYTAYTYLSGCVPHFSYKATSFDKNPEYTYGVTSFQGFIRPLYQVYEMLGGGESGTLFERANARKTEIETAMPLGDDVYNGYISMFYYFYVDGGTIGVFIISILVSIFINLCYIKYTQKGTLRNMIIYLLSVQIFLFSFFQFMLSNLDLAMAFIYCLFFLNEKYIIRIENVGRCNE